MRPAPWDAVPVFGPPPDPSVVVRPSAYAIVLDARGRIAAVRAPDGVFLPGGGIEGDETPDQAVVREAREECGLRVRLGRWEARAIQLTRGAPGAIRYEKRSTFRDATVEPGEPEASEPDHELVWIEAGQASVLTDASQRWAVEQWSTAPR